MKRGRKMDDVSKLWNHTHQLFAHIAHLIRTARNNSPTSASQSGTIKSKFLCKGSTMPLLAANFDKRLSL